MSSDRDALAELGAMLRDVAGRLDRIKAVATEAQARFICDLLEPSVAELGAQLDTVQKGEWVDRIGALAEEPEKTS